MPVSILIRVSLLTPTLTRGGKTVEVNIRGPYLIARYLLRRCQWANIINLSSGKGFSPGQNSAAYHVSKAGLNMLTEGLANELWERGITVNTLVPGPTATTR